MDHGIKYTIPGNLSHSFPFFFFSNTNKRQENVKRMGMNEKRPLSNG